MPSPVSLAHIPSYVRPSESTPTGVFAIAKLICLIAANLFDNAREETHTMELALKAWVTHNKQKARSCLVEAVAIVTIGGATAAFQLAGVIPQLKPFGDAGGTLGSAISHGTQSLFTYYRTRKEGDLQKALSLQQTAQKKERDDDSSKDRAISTAHQMMRETSIVKA